MLNVGNQFLLDVFYSIQGHSILFYSIRCILFCSILFYSVKTWTLLSNLQMHLSHRVANEKQCFLHAWPDRPNNQQSKGHSRGPGGPPQRRSQPRPLRALGKAPAAKAREPERAQEVTQFEVGGKLGTLFVLHFFGGQIGHDFCFALFFFTFFALCLLCFLQFFCTFFRTFLAFFFSRGKCKVFAFPEPQKKWVKSGGKNSRASKKVGEKLGEKKGGKSERPQTPTPKRALTVASWSRSVSPGPSSSRVRFMGCRVQPVQDGASHLRQKTPQDPFSWLWPCRLCSLQMLGLGELELEHRDSMYAGLACQICLVVLVWFMVCSVCEA